MDKHFKVFVLSQVEVGCLVDGASVAVDEVLDGHLQRLLIDTGGLHSSNHQFLLDARRDDVRHGFAAAVLVDADCRNIEGGRVAVVVGLVFARSLDALGVGAPFAFHEIQGGETQHNGFAESGDEHTHEANGRVVVDVADDFVGQTDGDAELIPSHATDLSVGQRDVGRLKDVGDMVVAHHHLGGVEVDDILVVALTLVQGVVVVDVFGVGQGRVAGGVGLVALLLVGGRVSFWAVVLLVAVQYAAVSFVRRLVPFR